MSIDKDLNKLKSKIKVIESEAEKQKNKLLHAYAVKNRRFEIGDILQDGCHVISVDKITWSSCSNGGAPFSIYYGYLLTKKLQPRKDEERQRVYGDRVVKIFKQLTNK